MRIKQSLSLRKNCEIEAELIRASYHAPVFSPLLNMLAAVATASLFVDDVITSRVVVWTSLVIATALARMVSLYIFQRKAIRFPMSGNWERLLLLIMGLNAASWGLGAYLLFVPGSFEMQMTLAAFISVTAIFVTMTTSYMPLVLTFQLLSMPPAIIMLLMQGTAAHYATAAVMVLLIITTIVIGSVRVRSFKELIRLRMELAREKESAEQANLAKSRFLAAASHDLRQPLHALSMFTGMLAMRAKTREDAELAQNFAGSVSALEMLLNALLDISKLDAGAVIAKCEDVRLQGLFARLADEYVPQADAKGLALQVDACELCVHSDPVLLETILRNLLSNAIRYTHVGSVWLRCRGSGEQVTIEVADTGVGIPQDKHAEVFREFYQLHNPERDRSKGLGLGLAIVDRLSRLLGHELHLNSEPGTGTVFTLILPRAAGTVPEAKPLSDILGEDETHAAQAMCVLVIDDERAIRKATRMLLESWGLRVITAESAQSALDAIGRTECEPDALIADLRLRNDETGLQAIDAIQRKLGRKIPAVVITGDTAPEQLQEAAASGYPVMHKPVAPARIRAFIRQAQRQMVKLRTTTQDSRASLQ